MTVEAREQYNVQFEELFLSSVCKCRERQVRTDEGSLRVDLVFMNGKS